LWFGWLIFFGLALNLIFIYRREVGELGLDRFHLDGSRQVPVSALGLRRLSSWELGLHTGSRSSGSVVSRRNRDLVADLRRRHLTFRPECSDFVLSERWVLTLSIGFVGSLGRRRWVLLDALLTRLRLLLRVQQVLHFIWLIVEQGLLLKRDEVHVIVFTRSSLLRLLNWLVLSRGGSLFQLGRGVPATALRRILGGREVTVLFGNLIEGVLLEDLNRLLSGLFVTGGLGSGSLRGTLRSLLSLVEFLSH